MKIGIILKRCPACEKAKDIEKDFAHYVSKKDGPRVQGYCKACSKEKDGPRKAAYRRAHPEAALKTKEYQARPKYKAQKKAYAAKSTAKAVASMSDAYISLLISKRLGITKVQARAMHEEMQACRERIALRRLVQKNCPKRKRHAA